MTRKICLALTWLGAITAMSSAILFASPARSAAQAVPDLPLALICWSDSGQDWRIGYLSRINKDGTATYMPPGGQQSATVNEKRIVEAPKSRGGVVDCYGKTIDELRSMGRTLEIQRPR